MGPFAACPLGFQEDTGPGNPDPDSVLGLGFPWSLGPCCTWEFAAPGLHDITASENECETQPGAGTSPGLFLLDLKR